MGISGSFPLSKEPTGKLDRSLAGSLSADELVVQLFKEEFALFSLLAPE